MFCISGFKRLDGIGENPCAEHRESNRCDSRLERGADGVYLSVT